jgi:hypothetical protein
LTLNAILFHIFQELNAPPTRVSKEGGEASAWKWYTVMDEAMQGFPLHHPTDHHLLIPPRCRVGLSPSQKGPDVEAQEGGDCHGGLLAILEGMIRNWFYSSFQSTASPIPLKLQVTLQLIHA